MADAPSAPTLASADSEDLLSDLAMVSDIRLQDSLTLPPDGTAVGTSNILSMFRQREVMVLQSVASGSTLCIYEGQVSGKGIRDSHSQFIVHLRQPGVIALQNVANTDCWLSIFEDKTLGTPGVIALQNVANTDCWLSIFEDKTLGTGNGGPYSEFYLHEIEDKYVALESVFYAGQHVGFSDDGIPQPPGETPPLDKTALFLPFPHSSPPEAPPDDLPPAYPGPPVPPVPTQLTPYEPPLHMPSLPQPFSPARYPPHMAGPTVRQVVPTEPTIPIGYNIRDIFVRGNSLGFIPRADTTGRPIGVVHSYVGNALRAKRSFAKTESEFTVEQSGVGTVIRNVAYGEVVCVGKSKKIVVVKKDYIPDEPAYQFIIRTIEGPIVAFESVRFPGHFMSISSDGLAKLEGREIESHNVHFTVRVKIFFNRYSTVITSPFSPGMPSIVNHLRDGSVIQLYHKPSMMFLCTTEGGQVRTSDKNGTMFTFCDRGMGRVSLMVYKKPLQKLRMDSSGKLSCMGPGDAAMDFYVKETQQRTLSFESVATPGKYIYMKIGKHKDKVIITDFSIFLLDMNRAQGYGRTRTIPMYALN